MVICLQTLKKLDEVGNYEVYMYCTIVTKICLEYIPMTEANTELMNIRHPSDSVLTHSPSTSFSWKPL